MRRRWTIRRQLITLLLVALAPLVALFITFSVIAWRNATQRVSEATISLARAEAKDLGMLIEQAENVATHLSRRPEVQNSRPGHCDPLLRQLHGMHPLFDNVVVANAAGLEICSTRQPNAGPLPSVADLPWFQAVMRDSAPPPSQPYRSRITGEWVSVVARQLLDDRGTVTGAVGVAIDLERLRRTLPADELPPGSTITVFDPTGTIVTRFPDNERWMGRNGRGVEIVDLALKDGESVVEADGLDHKRRIYGYTTVPHTRWRVYAGVPLDLAYARVRQLTQIGIAIVLIALILTVGLGSVLLRRVEKPLRQVDEGIDALQRGGAHVSLPPGSPAELKTIVDSLNELLAHRTEDERRVAERGALLEGILDGTSDLISVRDLAGRVIHVNTAVTEWLGRSREEILGHSASDLTSPAMGAQLDEAARRVIESGKATVTEETLTDGHDDVFVVTRTPLRSPDDRVIGVIAAAKDVTELRRGEWERRRLEHELRRREAVSALGAMVGSVAHEVRNPLFAISSTLDAFAARFGDRPDQAPYVEVLRRETERLNRIMNDLLDYGRARVEELKPGPVMPVIQSVLELCRPQADERHVNFEVRVAPGLPQLAMDRDRLLMALRNIVDNAVRHAPEESDVTIEVKLDPASGAGMEFKVSDEGPGFAPEVLQRLFEPFITKRPGGIGLGLYIVKRVIEDHGGKITVENAPDGGGRVRMWLPLDHTISGSGRDAA